jgi:hypothetical protein
MSGKMEVIVRNRLANFLLKDKAGVRKSLLKLFLQGKTCTTKYAYDCLIKQGFNVNHRGVSSQVGHMHSRLGILRITLTPENNVYSLKENYWHIADMVLTAFKPVI